MAPLAAAELLSGSPDNKVVRDARTSVAAAVSTEDAATGAGKKLADGLNKPEVTSRAYEDVKQLATMIIQVRSSFGIISTALTIWDFVGLKDSSGNKVVLGPKWNSLTNVSGHIYTKEVGANVQDGFAEVRGCAKGEHPSCAHGIDHVEE